MSTHSSAVQEAPRPFFEKTVAMSTFDNDPLTRATAFLELGGMHQEEYEGLVGATQGAA